MSQAALRWPHLRRFFTIVRPSGAHGPRTTHGVHNVRTMVKCLLCRPATKLLCLRTTSWNLVCHLKIKHSSIAVAVGCRKRRKEKMPVTHRRSPRQPVVSAELSYKEEVRAIVTPPVPSSVPEPLLQDFKEEVMSSASNVASDSVDSGAANGMMTVTGAGPALHLCSVSCLQPGTIPPDDSEGADMLFLRSVLHDMKAMTARQKNKFKLAVLTAVDTVLYT